MAKRDPGKREPQEQAPEEFKLPGGYHMRTIKKGKLGHPSKIREELEELEDALEQGVRIMALVEMADLYGALQAVAEAHGSTMEDLQAMHRVTQRAFQNGARK